MILVFMSDKGGRLATPVALPIHNLLTNIDVRQSAHR